MPLFVTRFLMPSWFSAFCIGVISIMLRLLATVSYWVLKANNVETEITATAEVIINVSLNFLKMQWVLEFKLFNMINSPFCPLQIKRCVHVKSQEFFCLHRVQLTHFHCILCSTLSGYVANSLKSKSGLVRKTSICFIKVPSIFILSEWINA